MVNPTAWAHVPDPGIRAGFSQGLAAVSQGGQDRRAQVASDLDKRKQDLENELGIKWQNLVEASYAISGAFAIGNDDIEAQNKLLTQAKDTMATTPDHPIAKGMDHLMSLPKGKERDALFIQTMEWLKDQGVFGKEKAKEGVESKFQKGTGYFMTEGGVDYHVTPILDPKSGKMRMEKNPIGGQLISAIGETPAERQAREETTAGGKEREKGEAGRIQTLIDDGLSAAQSTSVLRRGLELLDQVQTGGWRAAALRAKQFLGVEGADEGELSNNLAKAVLAQLKATFGAAFTAEEGERLARIEAGFTKSPETNKRLLGQALKIAERKAKKALRQAEKNGDQEAVDEINDWLEFTLSDPEDAEAKPEKKIKRTGKHPTNGRPIVEYEDGTLDYAD